MFFLAAGVIRPFMIFVTEEVFIGQLFDAYIFRMKKTNFTLENFSMRFSFFFLFRCVSFQGISQVATISMRDNPEDEIFVSGIK